MSSDGVGGASPELRASYEDREQVADMLRIAAGDGRLTSAELDERLEAALTARTKSELAGLTTDLPTAGRQDMVGAKTKEVVRIDCHGGATERQGNWAVPRRLEIRLVGGKVRLDFTNAVIIEPVLHIEIKVTGGSLTLVTRPDIEVDIDNVSILGGRVRVQRQRAPVRPPALRIEVAGEVRGGKILARKPRAVLPQKTVPSRRPTLP